MHKSVAEETSLCSCHVQCPCFLFVYSYLFKYDLTRLIMFHKICIVSKVGQRNVTAETRKYAAIRLAASTSSLSQELSRMVRDAKEQYARRRGWVRIFPTSETWNNYGALLEYSSSNNLILHEHLFPDVMMKPANRVRSR